MREERSKHLQIKVKGLHEPDDDDLKSRTTPAERIEMMWQLAQDEWSKLGPMPQPKMHRDVVHVISLEDDR